jgi:hypothetical protein
MFNLPEEDVEFLTEKKVTYRLVSETTPDGGRRNGIIISGVPVPLNLLESAQSGLTQRVDCEVMIVLPSGYASTKLDSFYTKPHLKRRDGSEPASTSFPQKLFEEDWQFWSRHLDDKDWRAGVDGIDTYLTYLKNELRAA